MKQLFKGALISFALSTSLYAAQDYYAIVNGEKITDQDIALTLQDPRIDFSKLPKKAQDEVIQQIINKKLISNHALQGGIGKDKQFIEALAKMKEDLAFQLWQRQELSKLSISEVEEKSFYNENKDKFKHPAILKAKHILVKTQKEAEDIIKKLDKAKNKEATFVKLAKSKSIGPSGKNGGDLGEFPENQMVDEFSQAAKKLNKNTYSKEPVKTQFGYHVIYLNDKQAQKTLTFEEVRDNIRQILMGRIYANEVKALAEKLRKKAKIQMK